jgi:hypothetical protein
MTYARTYTPAWLFALLLGCAFMVGCGDDGEMDIRQQEAVQIVKAHAPEVGKFTVISNVEKMSQDSTREGDPWELGPWQAGFPSQKDRMVYVLSQYFSFTFKPSGDYWVRFTYKDKNGTHEALWDVNVYTKKVIVKNEVAQQLTDPTA